MSVFKRGDSYVYDFWYRKQRYRGTLGPVTELDARQAEAFKKQQVAKRYLFGSPVGWDVLVTKVRAYETIHLRSNSLKAHRAQLAALEPYFAHIPLEQLTLDHLEDYKQARLAQGMSRSTINLELSMLRRMCQLAYEWRMLKELPIRRWPTFPKHQMLGRTRVLTHEEEARLLMASSPTLRDFVCLALQTGLRHTELCTLTWDVIHLDERYLTILACYSKNHKEETVPLNVTAVNLLRERRARSATGLVFGEKAYTVPLRRTRRRAGLGDDVTAHVFRHTFATRLLAKGVPVVVVKDLMRHSDVHMTMRYNLTPMEHLYDAVDSLVPKRQTEPWRSWGVG